MGALETNTTLIYGVHLRESANDGSDFTSAATDYRIVFLGEDGQLHAKDSAGTVTDIGGASGSVATDAIWDAAGDLAVGSGANTAAKLSKGTALQVLRVNSGATALEWATPAGLAYSGACVYRSTSTQAISSATDTAIAFNGEVWDTDSYHDNVTNNSRLTLPVTGRYNICGTIAWEALDNTDRYARLYLNGSEVAMLWRLELGSATYGAVNFSMDFEGSAADYAEIFVYQTSGAFEITPGSARTRVCIKRLS